MRARRGFTLALAALAAAAVLASGALARDSGSGSGGDKGATLRIGWAQNPKTLNPFVGQDEEDYSVWALTWDLLVNFSEKDLTPVPGIAKSWEVSPDKKTVTFKLDPTAKWSDGKPVTSADVKYSLETLGGHGALFTSYTDNVTSIKTPDPHTVVINTKRPDARIVGGLFIYILPEHIWGKVPVKDLTGSYQPDIPMVGSGPYVVSDFQPNRFLKMDRNPYWRGPKPPYASIDFIRYGNQDAAERALQLGEVDLVPEVSPANFERLGKEGNIETLQGSTPAYTQLAFNVCPPDVCPDAWYPPASPALADFSWRPRWRPLQTAACPQPRRTRRRSSVSQAPPRPTCPPPPPENRRPCASSPGARDRHRHRRPQTPRPRHGRYRRRTLRRSPLRAASLA